MARHILDEEKIHPTIRDIVANHHRDIVEEVQVALAEYDVLVVGMKQNPFPKKARARLDAKGTPYKYLEYGSYLNSWRRRTALKLWTGWPTFPMIFIKGTLIGGASELQALDENGELDKMLA